MHELVSAAAGIERRATTVRELAGDLPFAPVVLRLDPIVDELEALIRASSQLFRDAALMLAAVEINRALLANRAGKAFSTSSDLADFLMIEEQIEPGAARNIASLAISQTREQGLEAAGITPELIDGAALLVIGREIKVEFEAISRYLAPRRFIERRTATGAPSPTAMRAFLDAEGQALSDERLRVEAVARRVAQATMHLDAALAAAGAAVES